MSDRIIKPTKMIRGALKVPGDKSISHRALMLGAVSWGETRIRGLLRGQDVMNTLNALTQCGVEIKPGDNDEWVVKGVGVGGLMAPLNNLDCGNSGTTLRLLTGVLAGNPGRFVLNGDESLSSRPMLRVVEPLRLMGADIGGREKGRFPPLVINGSRLRPIRYEMPVASAQVKSAILLAGLHVDGKSQVMEPAVTRDHTERMLKYFGVLTGIEDGWIWVRGPARPGGRKVTIPGDFSSAAYFLAMAAILPGALVQVLNVGLNPTRCRFLEIIERMGAHVEVLAVDESGPEPLGDIEVSYGDLQAVQIEPGEVPLIIDEIPVLAALAAFAQGETRINGAQELRVKESDRIEAVCRNLEAMGAEVNQWEDGFSVTGGRRLKGAEIFPVKDHRIAMAMAVAALGADGQSVIHEAECVDISFPGFFDALDRIRIVD